MTAADTVERVFREERGRILATLIRACGTENEGHWAGTIAAPVTYVVDPSGKVKWAYVSASAADRPSPVALAKAACTIAAGKEAPAEYPGK